MIPGLFRFIAQNMFSPALLECPMSSTAAPNISAMISSNMYASLTTFSAEARLCSSVPFISSIACSVYASTYLRQFFSFCASSDLHERSSGCSSRPLRSNASYCVPATAFMKSKVSPESACAISCAIVCVTARSNETLALSVTASPSPVSTSFTTLLKLSQLRLTFIVFVFLSKYAPDDDLPAVSMLSTTSIFIPYFFSFG